MVTWFPTSILCLVAKVPPEYKDLNIYTYNLQKFKLVFSFRPGVVTKQNHVCSHTQSYFVRMRKITWINSTIARQ